MIIEEPNDFSPTEDWEKFLAELKEIDLSKLSEEDAQKVLDAIELAKAHLT
jgi:hypothetical protein